MESFSYGTVTLAPIILSFNENYSAIAAFMGNDLVFFLTGGRASTSGTLAFFWLGVEWLSLSQVYHGAGEVRETVQPPTGFLRVLQDNPGVSDNELIHKGTFLDLLITWRLSGYP